MKPSFEGTERARVRTCIPCHFRHLYGIRTTDKLAGRFDLVDIEAIPAGIITKTIFATMKGPLSWVGGKNRIATQIIGMFPKHVTYVEAFAGGAQVLFRKEPSRVEVLNDLDGEVVNFFRMCQSHYEELVRSLKFVLVSRRWFGLLDAQNPGTLTDIQRAVRFFFLQKTSYAGLVRHHNYHYSVLGPPSFNPDRVPELLEKTHNRLQRVQIECLPYGEVLTRFDRPTTLFYLDPPYWGCKLYRFNFSENDFKELETRLRKISGMFILSLNDLPEVRKLFSGFSFREITLPYSAQKTAGKRFSELLITNFSPE